MPAPRKDFRGPIGNIHIARRRVRARQFPCAGRSCWWRPRRPVCRRCRQFHVPAQSDNGCRVILHRLRAGQFDKRRRPQRALEFARVRARDRAALPAEVELRARVKPSLALCTAREMSSERQVMREICRLNDQRAEPMRQLRGFRNSGLNPCQGIHDDQNIGNSIHNSTSGSFAGQSTTTPSLRIILRTAPGPCRRDRKSAVAFMSRSSKLCRKRMRFSSTLCRLPSPILCI